MAQKNVAEKSPTAKPRRQRQTNPTHPRLQITVHDHAKTPDIECSTALAAFGIIGRELGQADREHFIVLHLNAKNRLLAKEIISIGSLNTSIVHPREVFRGAVMHGSTAIIIAHNHPSGDTTPSHEDKEITSRLCAAGELLGIRVLDHIIVGGSWYLSLADKGEMPALQGWREQGACECKLTALRASCEIDAIRQRLNFVSCLDWRVMDGNDGAQSGFSFLIDDIEQRLKAVSEQIHPTEKKDEPKEY